MRTAIPMNRPIARVILKSVTAWTPLWVVHDALCHPDGEACPDGCDRAGDPEMVAFAESLGWATKRTGEYP